MGLIANQYAYTHSSRRHYGDCLSPGELCIINILVPGLSKVRTRCQSFSTTIPYNDITVWAGMA